MKPHPLPGCPVLRQGGGAAVEFALLLTLLVTIMGGVFAFGRTFWYYDALSKATRNAARTLSVAGNAKIASVAAAAAKSDVKSAATAAGLPGFTVDNVLVKCLNATMVQSDCTDGSAPSAVRVAVTGYTVLLGSTIPFLLGADKNFSLTLSPATTMPYMK